ncbi:MAG: ribosomal-processing cysteine protease Prp [Ruminococcaceae bacterium]|nr:ribosomal-processing cysteine protease Prp [Oscillospiraceae bacterium]
MTQVEFFYDRSGVNGFSVKGHSSFNCDDEEGKVVCSAVSSAVYMTANTLTEIIGDICDIDVDDALFVLRDKTLSHEGRLVLEGLKLHLSELSLEYTERIKILTEV